MKGKMVASLLIVMGLVSQTGCAVFMAAKQPPRKDLSVLTLGTPRGMVLAELGQPVTTETRNGKTVDVFSFTQGYSKPAKAARAVFHGAADLFTLGLWEIVGTPTEAVFDGTKMALQVTYDTNERVESVADLKGGQMSSGQPAPIAQQVEPAAPSVQGTETTSTATQ